MILARLVTTAFAFVGSWIALDRAGDALTSVSPTWAEVILSIGVLLLWLGSLVAIACVVAEMPAGGRSKS